MFSTTQSQLSFGAGFSFLSNTESKLDNFKPRLKNLAGCVVLKDVEYTYPKVRTISGQGCQEVGRFLCAAED